MKRPTQEILIRIANSNKTTAKRRHHQNSTNMIQEYFFPRKVTPAHASRRGKRMKFPAEVTRFPWKLPEPLEPRVCAITRNSSTLRRHEWAWSDVRRKRRVASVVSQAGLLSGKQNSVTADHTCANTEPDNTSEDADTTSENKIKTSKSNLMLPVIVS